MSDNQWTWLSGSQDINQKGVYGTLNIPSSLNVPGARESHSMTIDPLKRLLYVFGGRGHGSSSSDSDVGIFTL